MAMSWKDNGHMLNRHEQEYLNKVEWLWNHLSSLQRAKIESSATCDTLKQENSKHCFIGQAIGSAKMSTVPHDNLLVDTFMGFAKAIFYDGPSYDHLLGRKVTKEEKDMLDDIYYAKIGNLEHQYKRANELVRFYIFNQVHVP